MKKPGSKGQSKVEAVLHEFKEGALHSGKGGPKVKKRAQAVAIALHEAGMGKAMKGRGRGR